MDQAQAAAERVVSSRISWADMPVGVSAHPRHQFDSKAIIGGLLPVDPGD